MINPVLYTKEKRPDQSMECAVGNFHIRNGATLWRINFGNFLFFVWVFNEEFKASFLRPCKDSLQIIIFSTNEAYTFWWIVVRTDI